MNNEVTIIGFGYVGAPLSVLFALAGFDVKVFDINPILIDSINSHNYHHAESSITKHVYDLSVLGKIKAFENLPLSRNYIICAPTPLNEQGSALDLSFIFSALDRISRQLNDGDLIVIESTLEVGSVEKILEYLVGKGINIETLNISYCPERIFPGNSLNELILNDRIVSGVTKESSRLAAELYQNIIKGKIIETSVRYAELSKLIENTYRLINVAFANEVSLIAEENNVDVWTLLDIANSHPRVNILNPGIGVGGHCVAVDPFSLKLNSNLPTMVRAADDVNKNKMSWVCSKIKSARDEYYYKKKTYPVISIFGLSYKANVSDFRESPSLKIIKLLNEENIDILCVDPHINYIEGINIVNASEAFIKSQICVIFVGHDIFHMDIYKSQFIEKKVLDFCGLFKKNSTSQSLVF